MRYEVRFANGYWRALDTYKYTTECLGPTQAWALEAVAEMNLRPRKEYKS